MSFQNFCSRSIWALFCSSVATCAFASTPAAIAVQLEQSREGDLAAQVKVYFLASGPVSPCEANSIEQIKVTKVSSGSAHETKVPGTATVYDGMYLVQRLCFFGTTFVGAYRDGSQAFFIKATRKGVENGRGVIVPSLPDVFTLVSAALIPEIY